MSSEDFKSFIVTNPDLVDEGIDVSGLRTNTDASILGNIPDYGGIQYEAYNPNRLSDLMRLYSGGFPMLDTPQAAAPVTTAPDTDNGGQEILPVLYDPIPEPINTPFEDYLIDEGIGVQGAIGDPVVAPGEIPYTQEQMDAENAIPVTQPMTGGITGDSIEVEDLINYQDPSNSDESGLDMSGTIGGAPVVGDFNEPTTTQGSLSQVQVPGLDDSSPQIGDPGFENYKPFFEPEQQNLIDQAFSKVGSTAENIMNDLSQIPGAVVDFANQTVDILGKKINVGKTLLSAGINKLVGGPISLVFDALGALGLEGGRGDVSDALGEKYGMDDIGRLTGGPMEGYSVGPDHAQTVQDRIDSIENRSAPQTEASIQKILELEAYKDEVIAAGSSGVITEEKDSSGNIIDTTVLGPGEFLPEGENLVSLEDQLKSQPVTVEEISPGYSPDDDDPADDGPAPSAPSAPTAPSAPSNPYSGGEGGVQSGMNTPSAPADDYDFSDFDEGDDSRADPTGTGNFDDATTGNDTSPGATGGEGGAGTGGSTKIVCTMMNDSYGFGSFRNKIWLKHSKDMAPEYQIGYHKIFLPLIKIAKTNKVVKKVLEHIAVHRTIDIRQESRGKTHLIGRVYRKILEPICYLVGKYAK